MRLCLRALIAAPLIIVCPAVSRADAILYSAFVDYSGLIVSVPGNPVLPSGSTVAFSFEVPSILTTPTDVTALLSSAVGSGFGACGALTDVLLSPNAPSTGGISAYPAYESASWSNGCGPGNQFDGASGGFAQEPLSLGVYSVYDKLGVTRGTMTIAAELNLQGGPSTLPTALTAALVAQVTGTIGGQGTEDYYTFYWTGGAFSATGSIGGTPNPGASYLLSEGAVGNCGGGSTETLNGGDSYTSTIAIANLAPGNYCIGIDANNSNDPQYTIAFNTAVDAATPEPSDVLLVSTGLGVIGVLRVAGRGRSRS